MPLRGGEGLNRYHQVVHKIRRHDRRGKGMAESFSREKLRHAPQKEGGWEILCDLPPVWPRLVRPLKSRMNGKKTQTEKTHTQALTRVWLYVTIIDINTIILQYYSFISFGFLLATICVWVWMVCSLHSVTTGSRDRANVSLIIIIIIIVVMLGYDWGLRMVINIICFKIPGSGFIFVASEYPLAWRIRKLYSILMYYLPKPLFVYVFMVLISIVGLYS